MADKKISQLTGATTPLAGTEVLPVVQSGSTVKVSAADVTAGRDVSAASVAVTGGSMPANGVYLPAANTVDFTSASAGRIRLTSGGEVIVNGTTALGAAGTLSVQRAGDPSIRFFRDDTTVSSGNAFGEILFYGNDTTGNTPTLHAYISTQASATHAAGDNATDIIFATTPDNSSTVREVARLNEAGNLKISIAGKGIDFSANTHAAGMTSELLNWYETGTWTPTLTCTDGNFNSVTYDPLRGGRYTRVGNMVHIQCYMRTDAVDNSVGRSGDVLIAGLPFAAVTATSGTIDGHSSFAVSVASAWAGEEPLGASVSGGDTNIQLWYRSAVDGNTANVVAADVGTGANANIVLIAGTYICA